MLIRKIWKNRALYLILLPSLIYFFMFHYVPFMGLTIAFKDFSMSKGLDESEWVGLAHFRDLFAMDEFYQVVKNTLLINVYKLLFTFPVPIIFALLLNEILSPFYKKTIQTITIFPHFLSWIVFGGIMVTFLVPGGLIPSLLSLFGVDGSNLLTNLDYFRSILVVTATLKFFGFGSIIYMAALSGIDPSLYEAARMDGANRWRQIIHITLPSLKPMIILMFMLELGYMMDANFEQVFVLYNPAVYDVADIVDTYVYRIGLGDGDFSMATAVGLFKGVVGFVLILTANYFIRKSGEQSLW